MALYVLESCTQPGTNFTVNSAVPLVVGQIYSFFIDENNGSCGTVVEDLPAGPVYTLGSPYELCEECLLNTPYEVNPPEYELCVKDCDGNPVVLTLPHPVYTNEYGTAVTQLNAVELGGVNGLNN